MKVRLTWVAAFVAAGVMVPVAAAHASGGTTGGPDLQISGSASTGSPNAGGRYSYTFQVKNGGSATADGATFTDVLPFGVGYESATGNGAPERCSSTNGVVTCDLLFMDPGVSETVVVNVFAPTVVGPYVSTGSVSTVTPETNLGNNSVSVSVSVKSPALDTIKVSKCFIQAGSGQMLLKAASSDASARLFAYRPDGSLIGEVQNGGGARYGGTVMPWQPYDVVEVTFRSTSGGSITVPTTPFIV